MYFLLHFHIPRSFSDPLEGRIDLAVELEAFAPVAWLVDRNLHDIATELCESVMSKARFTD